MKLATGAKDKVGYGAIIAMAEGVDSRRKTSKRCSPQNTIH